MPKIDQNYGNFGLHHLIVTLISLPHKTNNENTGEKGQEKNDEKIYIMTPGTCGTITKNITAKNVDSGLVPPIIKLGKYYVHIKNLFDTRTVKKPTLVLPSYSFIFSFESFV